MPRKYIDFVLVWETPSSGPPSVTADPDDPTPVKKSPIRKDESGNDTLEKRRIFERNLEEEGLHLERETLEGSNLNFVKIHSSMPVLR